LGDDTACVTLSAIADMHLTEWLHLVAIDTVITTACNLTQLIADFQVCLSQAGLCLVNGDGHCSAKAVNFNHLGLPQ